MQFDVVELLRFYRSPLGRAVALLLGKKLKGLWPRTEQCRLLGLGFTTPYLEGFSGRCERVAAFMPASLGVYAWPKDKDRSSALVDVEYLPLPDASVDQILMVHALEMASDPMACMQEAWRVLTPGGRLLLVVPSRSGVWARVDTSPFGFGRPFSRGQLSSLLRASLFSPERVDTALYLPPSNSRFVLRAAKTWERLGSRLCPALSGVLIVEASKQLFQGLPSSSQSKIKRALRPALAPAATSIGMKKQR